MDLVRSCYRTLMRVQEGADPVAVEWSFCQPGAQLIGVPTPFCSSRWELGDDLRWESYLGEQQGPQPFVNGIIRQGLTGRKLCFPLGWFTTGVPTAEVIERPVDSNGVPACCQDARPQKGGCIVGGTGKPKPFNCRDLPEFLTIKLRGSGVCACLNNVVVTIHRGDPELCQWTGQSIGVCTFGALITFTLSFAANVWSCAVDCFLGTVTPKPVATNWTPSPFKVSFDIVDNVACCGTFGSEPWGFDVTL